MGTKTGLTISPLLTSNPRTLSPMNEGDMTKTSACLLEVVRRLREIGAASTLQAMLDADVVTSPQLKAIFEGKLADADSLYQDAWDELKQLEHVENDLHVKFLIACVTVWSMSTDVEVDPTQDDFPGALWIATELCARISDRELYIATHVFIEAVRGLRSAWPDLRYEAPFFSLSSILLTFRIASDDLVRVAKEVEESRSVALARWENGWCFEFSPMVDPMSARRWRQLVHASVNRVVSSQELRELVQELEPPC